LWALRVVRQRSLWRADHSARGVLQIVVFVSEIRCNKKPSTPVTIRQKEVRTKKKIIFLAD
jgi:hypothetical protein